MLHVGRSSLRGDSVREMTAEEKTNVDHAQTMDVALEHEPLQLKRNIGLISGISYVAGLIIGSGIWITPQGVLRNTGSVGLCLILWCVGGVIAMLGTLTYCELVSVVRTAGGDYAIFTKTLGRIPGFLFIWIAEVARNPSSRAVQALTFATYLSEFLDVCGSPLVIKKLIGVSALILVCIFNCYSTELGARIQVIFTALKILALLMIIVGGLVAIAEGEISELPTGFQGTITVPANIARALLSVGYSYAGWNNLNYAVEEVKNPRRNVILSTTIGTMIVTFVYIMTNISYLAVMTRAEIFQSEAVALTWGQKMLGPAAIILPLAVMISTLGSMNGSLGTLTRAPFAAARDGNWFDFLCFISVKRYTPVPAIVIHIMIAIVFLVQGTVTSLIGFMSFFTWIIAGLGTTCLLILRIKDKHNPERFKVPILIPIVFLLVCVFLVVTPIVQHPHIETLYAVLFVVGGILLYLPAFHFKFKPKFVDKIEIYLQLIFELAPSSYVER